MLKAANSNNHLDNCNCEDCQKKAFIAAYKLVVPSKLTNKEVIEFITMPIYMGLPIRKRKPKRGPQSNKTQYDEAYERRKGLYHKLVRLPKSGCAVRVKRGQQFVEVVNKALSELPRWLLVKSESHKINKWVADWLKSKGLSIRHRTTIFRAIKKLPPIDLQQ